MGKLTCWQLTVNWAVTAKRRLRERQRRRRVTLRSGSLAACLGCAPVARLLGKCGAILRLDGSSLRGTELARSRRSCRLRWPALAALGNGVRVHSRTDTRPDRRTAIFRLRVQR